MGAMTDKDEKLKLHTVWFCEWAELESVFKRKEIGAVKSFLSSTHDLVRPPYGRSTIRYKRQSVIVGSTNEDQFLADPTGRRRFWVIPVTGMIDTTRLAAERDQIWAAATSAYDQGEQWDLTNAEKIEAEAITKGFEITDPWLEIIEAYCSPFNEITIKEILTQGLSLSLDRIDKATEMRAARSLKQLGWERRLLNRLGKVERKWFRVSPLI
jgi:predicted P-loop ATPase